MLEKIHDIQNALANQNILSALALALTLPDVCGKVEYPSERFSKTSYIRWFDEWTRPHFMRPIINPSNMEEESELLPYFTGAMCYSLRCSFLHAGNVEMNEWSKEKESEVTYKFQLVTNGATGVGSTTTYNGLNEISIVEHVSLNVIDLCNFICMSAEQFYNKREPQLFENHQIRIFDYEAYLKSLEI